MKFLIVACGFDLSSLLFIPICPDSECDADFPLLHRKGIIASSSIRWGDGLQSALSVASLMMQAVLA